MVTRTGPSHLTARERARRTARGGSSRSVPAPLLAPALIAIAFLVLPLAGLLIRAPWGHLGAALSGSDATQALILSLWTATVTTGISLVIGVPLAWVLARGSFPGQRLLRALVTLPLVLPPVVGGVALLLAFSRVGFVGRYLDDWFGLTIPAADNASTLYPIATITSSKHESEAQAFVAYVLSPAGQQVLTAAGFEQP